MPPREVFLSHSSGDAPFVTRLAATLQRHGVPVWYSKTHILGAQQWHDEIGAALTRCDWFVLVLSPLSVESMWVKRELTWALQQKRLDGKVVPAVLEACDASKLSSKLSWVLPSVQTIDFSTDFDAGCRDLFRIWGYGYQPAKAVAD